MKIIRVISGCQSGADIGGLRAAEACGIPTGGFAPKNYLSENGPDWCREMALQFGLTECQLNGYPERTKLNVLHSNCTMIFGFFSPGSNMMQSFCEEYKKPCIWIDTLLLVDNLAQPHLKYFLNKNFKDQEDIILNIAGNRESKNPGIEALVYNTLKSFFLTLLS